VGESVYRACGKSAGGEIGQEPEEKKDGDKEEEGKEEAEEEDQETEEAEESPLSWYDQFDTQDTVLL